MTAVAVAILDRDSWDANTDIIVIADPERRQLTWVPRDLWSPGAKDRISRAFALGGGPVLIAALNELGFPCKGLLCLRRGATEAALSGLTVTVPVTEPLDFWYPLSPTAPIEEGRKAVSFKPPHEVLSGERLHQWIGARTMMHRAGSDLDRLARQQVLVRQMLAAGIDFRAVLADPERVQTVGEPALPVLSRIDPSWTMTTFDAVDYATIDGKRVLVRRADRKRPSLWQRVRAGVRRSKRR